MSSVDFNKVMGAILVALLAAVSIGIFINETMHPHIPQGEEIAYKVDTGASESVPAAAETAPMLEPVAPLLAAADPAAGEGLAKKRCASCHTFDQGGPNKVGPNLFDSIGGPKGAHADFGYSEALKEKGGDWDYAALNAFLAKPKDYIPKTKMNFPGFKKASDRAAVIAYLRQQSSNPPPLP